MIVLERFLEAPVDKVSTKTTTISASSRMKDFLYPDPLRQMRAHHSKTIWRQIKRLISAEIVQILEVGSRSSYMGSICNGFFMGRKDDSYIQTGMSLDGERRQ